MVEQFLKQNNISVDAMYSKSSEAVKPDEKASGKRCDRTPYKQAEIWEDYKQIYIDFDLKTEKEIREKILFVNSFDCDLNVKSEKIKFDSKGYFLIDAKCKPAKPLVEGLPLSYETKEKEISSLMNIQE